MVVRTKRGFVVHNRALNLRRHQTIFSVSIVAGVYAARVSIYRCRYCQSCQSCQPRSYPVLYPPFGRARSLRERVE